MDPANPQSFNRYSYVLNNPLAFTDPTGQFTNGSYCGDSCPDGGSGGGGLIGILVDIGNAIAGLFGGPSFHGSLQPRPNTPSSNTSAASTQIYSYPPNLTPINPGAPYTFQAYAITSGIPEVAPQLPTIGEILGGLEAGAATIALPLLATGELLMMQGDNKRVDDETLSRCAARYEAEKDRCWARFGSGGRFGKNRAVGACLDRAFYRYQACVRGQPDPAGPMAKSQEVPKDESNTSFLSLATMPIKWETAKKGVQ